MSWSRAKSRAEELMVEVLEKRKKPMSLLEIVEEIKKIDAMVFNGKTPRNSLYSIVYRREKKREKDGAKKLFKTIEERRETLYILNV